MLIVTFKQWTDGNEYTDGHYIEDTLSFKNSKELLKAIEENSDNPMIISGIWELKEDLVDWLLDNK